MGRCLPIVFALESRPFANWSSKVDVFCLQSNYHVVSNFIITDNELETDVVSFVIDNNSRPGPLEAMSADLWIRVFVRKRKNRRRKSRGKKIKLHVVRVNGTGSRKDILTTLMTRVKKTRWQKLDLPITFIQSLLDSRQHILQLRINCEACGRRIQPILNYKWKRFRRRRKKVKRDNRNKNKANKLTSKRRKRLRDFRNQAKPPFLVIRTRHVYPISTSHNIWRH